MPTEETLQFDERTATTLAKTGERMKPRGVARVYYPRATFQFDGDERFPNECLVLTPEGKVIIMDAGHIDAFFEPVKKRTKKGERNAATTL